MKRLFRVISSVLIVFGAAARATADDPSTTTPQVIQHLPPEDPRFDWWRRARFGMFIHFDPSAVIGQEISWSRGGVRRDRKPNDKTGPVPPDVYDNLYKRFDPEKFDATQWVHIAADAGMKYIVPIAKHHDGFCVFDSALTDYKITNTPFKRDYLAELARATHAAGLHFGFYYSPPDWHNPDFFTANHARYIAYLHGQIRELLTHYGQVDELWFDRDGGVNTPATWDAPGLFAMVRTLQPQIICTTRCAGWGDFSTPEQRIGKFNTKPWECCMTIASQWSWKPNDRVKTLTQCIDALVSCAGGDGNLLLNVGPNAQGEIEPEQVARLHEIGQWLRQNGQSIYATRGGPFLPKDGVYSTRAGNTIYVHILKWDTDTITLPPIPAKIVANSLLSGGGAKVEQTDAGIGISVDPADRQGIDTIVKLDLNGSAMGITTR